MSPYSADQLFERERSAHFPLSVPVPVAEEEKLLPWFLQSCIHSHHHVYIPCWIRLHHTFTLLRSCQDRANLRPDVVEIWVPGEDLAPSLGSVPLPRRSSRSDPGMRSQDTFPGARFDTENLLDMGQRDAGMGIFRMASLHISK
jgi:hypothetical protein